MIQDIKRNFRTILDLGSGPGHFSKLLEVGKVQKSIMLDSSGNFLFLALSMFV
jgi:NADH dehydrogenase [ubiquinone] 1 alpha subcomplex assembly factor 5